MTAIELNKRMHEIMGLCWHEVDEDLAFTCRCANCGDLLNQSQRLNHNFLAWEGFGVAWEWLQKYERKIEFFSQLNGYYGSTSCEIDVLQVIPWTYVNPRALAEAIVEFFKEEAK